MDVVLKNVNGDSMVVGGTNNMALAEASTVVGGADNVAEGTNSLILGGQGNQTQAEFEMAP